MTEAVADKRSTKQQQRLETIMAIEDDAWNPKYIDIISATDFRVPPPYVYWQTVRLRCTDEVKKEGIPFEKVDAVIVWRRKCAIFLNRNACCAYDSSAAAAGGDRGNAGSAHAFDLGLERWVHTYPPILSAINFYLIELTKRFQTLQIGISLLHHRPDV